MTDQAQRYQLNRDQTLYVDLLKKVLTASIYDESAWSLVENSGQRLPPHGQPHASRLLRALVPFLRRRSLVLMQPRPFLPALRAEGKDWPAFGYTMIGERRLDNIQHCVESVLARDVAGDFIETGVWRGGSVIFMRALLKTFGVLDRKVWVADSFEGLPAPKSKADGLDLTDIEQLKVSLQQVRANFEKFGLLDQQVEFLEGWFEVTLPRAPIEKLAILRLDGDLYSSTLTALTHLYDRVSPGGFVIVDDYYSWPSARRAVTDFLNQRSLAPAIVPIDWSSAYWQV